MKPVWQDSGLQYNDLFPAVESTHTHMRTHTRLLPYRNFTSGDKNKVFFYSILYLTYVSAQGNKSSQHEPDYTEKKEELSAQIGLLTLFAK